MKTDQQHDADYSIMHNEEQTGEIVLHPSRAAQHLPALLIEEYKERDALLTAFVQELMIDDVDYASPTAESGSSRKTLTKSGMEKLVTYFGLVPELTLSDRMEDWEQGIFYYRYRCDIYRNGELLISGIEGSANTREKKYRYRVIADRFATEGQRQQAIRTENRTNGKYTNLYHVLPNEEPYDLVNTVQKMAQKRALIAAVTIAVNASRFFDGEQPAAYKKESPVEAPPPPPAPSLNRHGDPSNYGIPVDHRHAHHDPPPQGSTSVISTVESKKVTTEVTSDWRTLELHFGKHKGTRLGDLPARSLAWYQENWEPLPYNGNPPSALDCALRAALDASKNPGAISVFDGGPTPPKTGDSVANTLRDIDDDGLPF